MSFSIPKVNSRSPLYQPIKIFPILAAANYLLNSCFWTKTCKLIYTGSEPGVFSVQPLPRYWPYVHLLWKNNHGDAHGDHLLNCKKEMLCIQKMKFHEKGAAVGYFLHIYSISREPQRTLCSMIER